jgi:hypothetical protein
MIINNKSKRVIFFVAFFSSLSMISLALIYYFGNVEISGKNGFNRTWFSEKATSVKDAEIKAGYIALTTNPNGELFLSKKDPRFIYKMTQDLSKGNDIYLKINTKVEYLYPYDLFIDSTRFILCTRNSALMFYGRLVDTSYEVVKFPFPLYTKAAFVSRQKLVFRAFDSSRKRQYFFNYYLGDSSVSVKNKLLSGGSDFGFSTDGALEYDSYVNKIFYLQFYGNDFYCMNLDLNVFYESKTIDTTNHNNVNLKLIKTGNNGSSLKPSSPLRRINNNLVCYRGHLYVCSNLKADNESDSSFSQNLVFDVYSSDNGKYSNSFYVKKYNSSPVLDFTIRDGILFLLYKSRIQSYKVPDK